MDAKLLFKADARLGEGALWNSDTQELYWVDIEGRTFNILHPATGQNRVYPTNKRVGTVVPAGDNHVVVALEDGIASINLDSGELNYKLNTTFHLSYNRRFNDGKCDPEGRLWVGTHSMSGQRGKSSLYSVGSDFSITEKVQGVSISNGIVWTADGKTMYYIDTPTMQIVQYDFDPESGHISDKKVVLEIPQGMGDPDGMAIDRDGKLWVALWDGFSVVQCDPQTGKILRKVNVPVPKVTSCAFGGPDMDTLYITTASVEMSDAELEQYPLSGSIFSVDAGVSGLPANKFVFQS